MIKNELRFKESREKMPVLFLGHGSPMNAIEENEFVEGFRMIGSRLPRPAAILCISAHWETRGTYVTAMEKPETIHDFGGFPEELYGVQYPAPGSPELAHLTRDLIPGTTVGLDHEWGLDHGAWSVIKHLYPEADIPVIEMSLDYTRPARYHYDLAAGLEPLRNKGVLVVCSGNIIHNLALVDWKNFNKVDHGFDWAIEAREKINGFLLGDDHLSLINLQSRGAAFHLSAPTPEHYLPLLYALAIKGKEDQLTLFNDKLVAGSLSMTSVLIDKS